MREGLRLNGIFDAAVRRETGNLSERTHSCPPRLDRLHQPVEVIAESRQAAGIE